MPNGSNSKMGDIAYKALCKYYEPKVYTYGEEPEKRMRRGQIYFREAVLKKLVKLDTYFHLSEDDLRDYSIKNNILCSIKESSNPEIYSELLPFISTYPFDEKKQMIFHTVFAKTTVVCRFAFSRVDDRVIKGCLIKGHIDVHLLS